jgi:hypothetical protein
MPGFKMMSHRWLEVSAIQACESMLSDSGLSSNALVPGPLVQGHREHPKVLVAHDPTEPLRRGIEDFRGPLQGQLAALQILDPMHPIEGRRMPIVDHLNSTRSLWAEAGLTCTGS